MSSTLLYGGCQIVCGQQDGVGYIQFVEKFPLDQFIQHGLNYQAALDVEKFAQEFAVARRDHPVFLLDPNQRDIEWAQAYLKDNPGLMKNALNRSMQNKELLEQSKLRLATPEELFAGLRHLLSEIPLDAGDLFWRWHKLLVTNPALPFADLEQVESRIYQLQEQGVLHHHKTPEDQTIFLPAPGTDRWKIQYADCQLIVDHASWSVLEIGDFHPQTHLFQTQQEWVDWFSKKLPAGSRLELSYSSPDSTIQMPEAGGLGDLHQWEALIGGSEEQLELSTEEVLEDQPPAAWMPGMHGVFVFETPEPVTNAPAQLAASIQIHNLGNLVHLGYPVQPSRLGKQSKAVRLFQPANPFRQAPLPMSRQD